MGAGTNQGSWFHRWSTRLAALAACVALAVGAVACGDDSDDGGGASGGSASGSSNEKYDVVLLNSFLGNTWRPIMLRTAEVLAEEGPLADRIGSLEVVNSENTPPSANAALRNIIATKPDILLVDAVNPTAQNQAIQAACDADITVVTFDVIATAPCAWKVGLDWGAIGGTLADWMANALDGEGTVLRDRGLAGTQEFDKFNKAVDEVFAEYPDIKVYDYTANVTPGGEQSGVNSLLSAHPNVAGILAASYGGYAIDAMEKAGRDQVPTTGWSYNLSIKRCMEKRVTCALPSSPTWVSGEALKLGIDVRDGKLKGEPRQETLDVPILTSGDIQFENRLGEAQPIDGAYLEGVNGGVMLPLSPPWYELEPSQVLEK
jgi:ribose transport system substrate-binding protein